MFDAEELDSNRLAEESENGVQPYLLEEVGFFYCLQQCDFLAVRETRDGSGSWKQLRAFRLRLSQPAFVEFLLVLIVAG